MKKVGPILIGILAIGAIVIWRNGQGNPGENGASIRIGAVLPFTGPAAPIGKWQQRGLDLALEEINAAGGIDGRMLEIAYEDSQSSPGAGVSALQKILLGEEPPIVFSSLSGVSNALIPITEDKAIVNMLLAVSLPGITDGQEYVIRCNLGSDDEAEAMAAYLADSLYRRIAVLHLNDEFGVGASEVFAEAAAGTTIEIVTTEGYDRDATDFRTLALKAQSSNPDAVYVIGYVNASVLLIKQLRELGSAVPVLGNMALSVPSFIDLGGSALDGAIFTVTEYDAESDRDEVRTFVDAYRDQHGEPPTFFAAFAYDGLKLAAAALAEGGSDAEALRASLGSIAHAGVLGDISVQGSGEIAFPTRIVVNKKGRIAPVGD